MNSPDLPVPSPYFGEAVGLAEDLANLWCALSDPQRW